MDNRKAWLTEQELVELLQVRAHGRTVRDLALELECPHQNLHAVLTGKRGPGRDIPEAMGFEPMTVYRPTTLEPAKKGKR